MLQFLKDLNRRHEELKKRVHSFRIPLSPRGQKIMGFVYFCIPVISGYYIMQLAIGQSQKNLAGLQRSKDQKKNEEVAGQNQALEQLLQRQKMYKEQANKVN